MSNVAPTPILKSEAQKAQNKMKYEPVLLAEPVYPIEHQWQKGREGRKYHVLEEKGIDGVVNLDPVPKHVDAQGVDDKAEGVQDDESHPQTLVHWLIWWIFVCEISPI